MKEFKIAWNGLIQWQLKVDDGEYKNSRVLLCMPLVGLVVGAACWFVANLAGMLVDKPLLAGFLGGVAIMALYGKAVRGPRLSALAELGSEWEQKRERTGSPPLPGVSIAAVLCLGWLLAGLVAISALITYSGTLWLLIPPILSMTAVAEAGNRGSGNPVPAVYYWTVAGALVVPVGFLTGNFSITLLALALSWMVGTERIRLSLPRNSGSRCWAAVGLLEVLLLWFGALGL